MKFVKTGIKLLLGNRLEVLSPTMAHFIIKVIKNHLKKLPLFPFFFETENLLNKNVGPAKINTLWRPQKQTKAAKMCKSSFGHFKNLILHWYQLDHFWPPKVLVPERKSFYRKFVPLGKRLCNFCIRYNCCWKFWV